MNHRQRGWLFYSLLGMFLIIFVITVLALIGLIKLVDGYLNVLFGAVILEVAAIGVTWFKRRDIFSETFDRTPTAYEPNLDAKRVLATFWKYQIKHFTCDPSKGLWAARLPQDRHQIPNFYRGIAELMDVGLLEVDLANNQAHLSMEGFRYCRRKNQELTQSESYEYL